MERAERQLMNEHVRSINNSIATWTCLRDTCMKTLQDQISDFQFQECSNFIERIIESRHQVVLKRQLSKFNCLRQRYRGVQSQEHAEDGHPNARLGKPREITTEVHKILYHLLEGQLHKILKHPIQLNPVPVLIQTKCRKIT